MDRTVQIRPLDPLIIRDGRSFDMMSGVRAHSLNAVTPSVLAGTLRTLLGKLAPKPQTVAVDIQKLIRKTDISGPLYMRGEKLFFPLPRDINISEITDDEHKQGQVHISARRPCKPSKAEGSGTEGFLGTGQVSLHDSRLWPVSISDREADPLPLHKLPAYISAEWMTHWLCDDTSGEWDKALVDWCEERYHVNGCAHFMAPFGKEIRTHTEMNDDTSVARHQHLFSSEALVFPPDVAMVARMRVSDALNIRVPITEVHSFGGKGRLASFQEIPDTKAANYIWQCPEPVQQAVAKQPKFLRMVLTTPAYFAKGWLPRWLNERLDSTNKLTNLRIRLRWACVPRWEGISGWSYRYKGPKAVRRMVPAGSVYFFEVVEGDPTQFVKMNWLKSMSDPDSRRGSFDQSDGCGMAVWGTWTPCQR